jgi:DNA mismatch repair protein MutL
VATLVPVSGESNGYAVRGLVQRPDAARPGFRRVHLFVEGRPFRDRAILRAADRGYRTTLAPRQRPWVFLYLEAPEGTVDVNVHPAKAEVRFRRQADVEALIESAVRESLNQEASAATLDSRVPPPVVYVREPRKWRDDPRARGSESESQMALFMSGSEPLDDAELSTPVLVESESPRLWQIHNMYILAETREGLLIIDQHSAHERILYQRLMDGFDAEGQESQRLLFPLTLRVGAGEYGHVEDLKSLLAQSGYEVDGFGGDTIIVQAVPNPHPYFDAERCLREMLEEITHGSELVRSARNQHERIAMTFACKGAIKAGQALAVAEMQELFDALFATELPYHDVHGRPTIVRLTSTELERKFGR